MDTDESLASGRKLRLPWYWDPPGRFIVWFAVIGFVAVGCVVFDFGFHAAYPGPLPPGAGRCGLAVLGGLYAMFIVAPLTAMMAAFFAACIGAIVDGVLSDRRRAFFRERRHTRDRASDDDRYAATD